MFTHTQTLPCRQLHTVENLEGRFYFTPTGKKYPSITTILGSTVKEHITAWRNSLGFEQADKETKRAAARGTAIHLMVEQYLKNIPNPTNGHKIEHITEFNTLRLYLNQIDNIRAQEIPVWSDLLRTAGRLDCVGEYQKVLSIIDFKTSTNNKSLQMIEDYWLQATAYALMIQECYDILIEQAVIIISVERGATPLIYKQPIEQYIPLLVKRINTYHKSRGSKNG